jgi:hypothetical protein
LRLIAAHLKDINETLQAQTALMSMREFPRILYDMVVEATDNNPDTASFSHLFFVYHPDTDWTGGFHRLIKKKPLSPRFCMHTNQLDSAVLYMKAVRAYLNQLAVYNKGWDKRPTSIKFHLLIPAYRPLVMIDPIKFPDDLGDFEVHGKIHNSHPLVWMHVSDDQQRFLKDIGFWKPPGVGFFESLGGFIGLCDKPRELAGLRVLGDALLELDNDTRYSHRDSIERDDSEDSDGSDGSGGREDNNNNHPGQGRRSKGHPRSYSEDTTRKHKKHSSNRPSSSGQNTRQRSEVRDNDETRKPRSRATRSKSHHNSTTSRRESKSRVKS